MPEATQPVSEFKTKKDYVYERLRAAIVSGAIRPGERLILSKVAAMAGTSLLPAREAILRLQAEGFVTSAPHVGARIAFPDIDKIEEVLLIRASLEALAIRTAAPHMTGPDFEGLDRIIQETEEACERRDAAALNRLNRAFHLRLIEACPLPRLKKMILDLWDESAMSSNLLEFLPQRSRQNLEEHRRIVRCLKKGLVDRAEALLSTHRENARKALRTQFAREGKRKKEKSPL